VEALLVSEEAMPESRTRYDAAADTWDDAADPDADDPGSFSGEPASEYDGDVEALFARDEAQPESRTRQEAATATWSDADSGQDARPDTSTDGTSSSQPGTVTESVARNDDREGDQPHPYARQVAVQTQAGTEVPITVEYVPPEARTVGDTTPTGIGRKPTGEEFLDMEGDEPAESGLDRLFRKATEEARDVRDAFGGTSETIHDFNLRGPAAGDGHAHEVQPVREPTPPGAPAFSDLVGSAALVGVAVFTGIRYGMRQLGKGDVQ
jgi:hypothetical protein